MVNHHNDARLWGTLQRKSPQVLADTGDVRGAVQQLRDFLVLPGVVMTGDPEIRTARRGRRGAVPTRARQANVPRPLTRSGWTAKPQPHQTPIKMERPSVMGGSR